MLHLGKESKRGPQAVLDKAVAFFGADGLGLALRQRTEESVAFEGGGGSVIISAKGTPAGKQTEVDIQSREWDYPVRQILGGNLKGSSPPSWVTRGGATFRQGVGKSTAV